ncbi:MAG: tetratricopeptide repeat protein [Bacteroidota bacterium]|nr:tetratricopeptide repeat protein [Bacteroidota bacterium]
MERLEMDVLMIRVNGCMNSGRYAEARRLLDRVIEAEPAHGIAHGMLGWICWALLDEHDRALVHFRCGVRWAPNCTSTWIHYMNLLAVDGHEEELNDVFRRALTVPGIDRTDVNCIVARYLERTGRVTNALTYYRNARNTTNDAAYAELTANIRRIRRRLRMERWSF